MIKSIELVNFLSHKKTKMTFGQGVNAIVGATDAGKSAIIKGFELVINNRPIGDAYRSNWGGTTKVTIYTENGSVARIKSNSVNKYIVRANGKVLHLTGFGTKVPAPVQEFLNMTEINLQAQMETHYLLSKSSWSAGEVAVHFNKIAHLHKIDIGKKNISIGLKRLERKIEADNTEVGRLKKELKEYVDIDTIEKKIINIELLGFEITKIYNSKTSLNINISNLIEIEKKIKEQSVLLPIEGLVNQILDYQVKIDKLELKRDTLNKLIFSIREGAHNISHAESYIKSESKVDVLIEVEEELEKKEKSFYQLTSTSNYLEMLFDNERIMNKEVKRLQKTFDNNMGNICILCGFKLKKKKS